jgi:hypothetical protein
MAFGGKRCTTLVMSGYCGPLVSLISLAAKISLVGKLSDYGNVKFELRCIRVKVNALLQIEGEG